MAETMMEQYMRIKNAHKNCLLFFRLGDFYELFFDDALVASKELGLTLTGRGTDENRAPMCGVPHHSADKYIAQLVENGYKVAVCEQTELPQPGKGLVNRDVVRVITPGTITDSNMLDNSSNNFAAAVFEADNGELGVAFADVSTGEFFAAAFGENRSSVVDELARIAPREVIVNGFLKVAKQIEVTLKIKPEIYNDWAFKYDNALKRLTSHFGVQSLDGFGISHRAEVCAAGALLQYFYETQKNALSHIIKITPAKNDKFMLLDANTRRNMELTSTIREKGKYGSLLWVLDKTKTSMGARCLRKWLEQPLLDSNEINLRLDAVGELKNEIMARSELRDLLGKINDLERLAGKLVYATATARDLVALKNSAAQIPKIKALINDFTDRFKGGMNAYFAEMMDELADIHKWVDSTLIDEPAIGLKDGGLVKDGFNAELDKLRGAKTNGSQWLLELETKERDATNIKNLKIKYNKIFGYFFEVTNSYLANVPDRFVRRQTLANCERFVTDELKEVETAVLSADERIGELEHEIFIDLRTRITGQINRILETANMLACIDAMQSLAETAEKNGYVRPLVGKGRGLSIKDGRHPVVEQVLNGRFVPNDTTLDGQLERISVITGPNMAGKSTYMRQVALIVLMAQIGSFVPADSAEINVVDRIFTRIGASDDLSAGQSTFMVEMNEMANILNNATNNSLIIVDEVGRGTSTKDGLAIAQAVTEHIADKIGAKTLFATHFHELAELEGIIDGVVNYCFAVKEDGENIIFLRKILKERMDKSYGIHVARLAGVPESVVRRSRDIMGAPEPIYSEKQSYSANQHITDDASIVKY